MSVNQAILERVVGQIAVGGQAHLLHQPRAVCAHRLHAERQRLGNVAGSFALGQLQEHLKSFL